MVCEPRSAVRPLLVVALALTCGSSSTPAAAVGAAQSSLQHTVFAIAIDDHNTPITDLTVDEWRVEEDGATRRLLDVAPATDPIDLVLIVDTSSSTQKAIQPLRKALEGFARTVLAGSPGSTISVMQVAGAAVLVANRKHAPEELDKVLSRTYADHTGGAVILEGLTQAAKQLSTSPSRRRAVVIVNVDGTPDQSGWKEPQRAVDRIVASEASIWSVSYRGVGVTFGGLQGSGADAAATGTPAGDIGSSGTSINRDPLLSLASEATGGIRLVVDVPTAIESALDTVSHALLAQYAVTYARPDGLQPRQLVMGQRRPGIKLVYPTTPPK